MITVTVYRDFSFLFGKHFSFDRGRFFAWSQDKDQNQTLFQKLKIRAPFYFLRVHFKNFETFKYYQERDNTFWSTSTPLIYQKPKSKSTKTLPLYTKIKTKLKRKSLTPSEDQLKPPVTLHSPLSLPLSNPSIININIP